MEAEGAKIRALFIDIDTKWPNLFFMQLSTQIKNCGGVAGFNIENPTHIYISCIIDINRPKAESSAMMCKLCNPDAIVDIGGSGWDIFKSRKDVESQYPDYSLYDMDFSYGFSSRGCNRACSFCNVTAKEGLFHRVAHPSKFHNPDFKKIVLIDNNILYDIPWFMEITDWILEKNLFVDFNQGLDIRLMTPEVAARIKELKLLSMWKIAFDDFSYETEFRQGVQMMLDAGIPPRTISAYIYCDGESQLDDAIERAKICRGYGINTYAMINMEKNKEWSSRMKAFIRWTRNRIVYWGVDADEYAGGILKKIEIKPWQGGE